MNEGQPPRSWQEVLAEPMTSVVDEGWRVVQTIEELSPRPQAAPVVVSPPESFVMVHALPQAEEEAATPVLPPSLTEQLSLTWAARRRQRPVEEEAEPAWPSPSRPEPSIESTADVTPVEPPSPPKLAGGPLALVTRLARRLLSGNQEAASEQAPQAPDEAAEAATPPQRNTRTGPAGVDARQPTLEASPAVVSTRAFRESRVAPVQESEPVTGVVTQPARPAELVLRTPAPTEVDDQPAPQPVYRRTASQMETHDSSPPVQSPAVATGESTEPVVVAVAHDLGAAPVVESPTFGQVLRRFARRLAPARAEGVEAVQAGPVPSAPGKPTPVEAPRAAVANRPTRVDHQEAPGPGLVHRETPAALRTETDAPRAFVETVTDSGSRAAGSNADQPTLTHREGNSPAVTASPAIENEADEGEPFSPVLRARLSGLVDVPLKDVRVFRNQAAQRLTEELHADAATIGDNIYLAPGEGNPGLPSGQALLAHELAHAGPEVGFAPTAGYEQPFGYSGGADETHALRLEHAVQRRDLAVPAAQAFPGAAPSRAWDGGGMAGPGPAGAAAGGGGSGWVNLASPFASSSGSSGGGGGGGSKGVALAAEDRPGAESQPAPAPPPTSDNDNRARSEEEDAGLIDRAVEAVMRRLRRDAALDSERRGAFRSELGG